MGRTKATARWLLSKFVNRHRFNDTLLYAAYLRVCLPDAAKQRHAERAFYCRTLAAIHPKRVFDIGANGGIKAAIFLLLAERVICVEPDPAAACVLRERFQRKPQVVVVEKGVGAQEGTAQFHVFADGDCYNTFSPKWAKALTNKEMPCVRSVAMTTLNALIAQYGLPGYIKIDVEGFELPVLQGLMQTVPLLSFECNLPEFTAETLEALFLLEKRNPTARFNFCVTEPPVRFEREQWLSVKEMIQVVTLGAHRFLEIYCRNPI